MKERPIRSIVLSLGELSRKWLDQKYSFRQKAVKRLVHGSGFSTNMAEATIDAIFSELTPSKLEKLLKTELRNPHMLDDFSLDPIAKTWSRAHGPESILHIFASNAPQPAILSFVLGMLLKSRNLGKVSSRDGGFLDIYLQSLKTVDHSLWLMNQLIDSNNKNAVAFFAKKVDLLVAYGIDESLEQIRKIIPATTPFFAYGHRISVAIFLKESLKKKNVQALARSVGKDIWMVDQRGCLSPGTIYAEKGGEVSPAEFAAHLALELEKLVQREKFLPRRDISANLAAYNLWNQFAIKKIKAERSLFWESSPRGLWAVAYEDDLKPYLASSSQIIVVKGYRKINEVFTALKPIQKYLQCAALECEAKDRKKIAQKLSEMNVNRICRAGKMQTPPITWHHDGKPNLASWIRWTDLE